MRRERFAATLIDGDMPAHYADAARRMIQRV